MVTVGGNRNPARPRGVGETNPANTEDILKMPKLKTLAALAAAVEAGRRYARKNPDQAGKYVDQAAAFVDKQTKGKYSGQIHAFVSLTKVIPQGMTCTEEIGDYLKWRLGAKA